MLTDRNGLEVLSRADALRLLATQKVGRIGITSEALPIILPVNFALLDGEILIRTGPGTKLDGATHDAVVAFEVDDFDALSHTGWSVSVTGLARVITEDAERVALAKAPIARWAPGRDERIIGISTELVSGRRMSAATHARRRSNATG